MYFYAVSSKMQSWIFELLLPKELIKRSVIFFWVDTPLSEEHGKRKEKTFVAKKEGGRWVEYFSACMHLIRLKSLFSKQGVNNRHILKFHFDNILHFVWSHMYLLRNPLFWIKSWCVETGKHSVDYSQSRCHCFEN